MWPYRGTHIPVCVLLCFIELILGNRYGPGVSSRESQGGRTDDWKSPKSLLNLSPFKSCGSPSSPCPPLNHVGCPYPCPLPELSRRRNISVFPDLTVTEVTVTAQIVLPPSRSLCTTQSRRKDEKRRLSPSNLSLSLGCQQAFIKYENLQHTKLTGHRLRAVHECQRTCYALCV